MFFIFFFTIIIPHTCAFVKSCGIIFSEEDNGGIDDDGEIFRDLGSH